MKNCWLQRICEPEALPCQFVATMRIAIYFAIVAGLSGVA